MASGAPQHKDIPSFLAALDSDRRDQVESLRAIVMQANPGLAESIKWNAPSYAFDDQDRVTFNVQNKEGLVTLVLHMGTGRSEDKKAPPIMSGPDGIAQWQSDIRAVITFAGTDDVAARRDAVLDFVRRWLAVPV